MSNNVSVPKEVFENVVAALRMYAESEWGWDGEDNSVVRSWGEVYPEPKGFHFKAGGDMAKIALGELQRLLTPLAPDVLPCGHPKSSLVRLRFGQLPYCEDCKRQNAGKA